MEKGNNKLLEVSLWTDKDGKFLFVLDYQQGSLEWTDPMAALQADQFDISGLFAGAVVAELEARDHETGECDTPQEETDAA